jgi:hypothetical protein
LIVAVPVEPSSWWTSAKLLPVPPWTSVVVLPVFDVSSASPCRTSAELLSLFCVIDEVWPLLRWITLAVLKLPTWVIVDAFCPIEFWLN